jgi:hypothetical protein
MSSRLAGPGENVGVIGGLDNVTSKRKKARRNILVVF